ncbi:MAG: long-chain fatty acid--CoA ligase [Deltaproteobacteria bacterium]|nr:long-chain fatty acid--CoA ligase [Deltaproteobacteria bacterium]MBT4264362.1 long-chain fatty acid--CoA ligase [Deltaproteobacteria bacterium]MBT4642061.1 long-chain fatty acid--CoA ligase [Deltaproteobacteria bacterium]
MEATINQVFKNRVKKYGDRLAVEKNNKGVWEKATWAEYYERSMAVGLGLYSLGIRHGDRIAILSDNRLEWIYTDMGGLGIGACVVAIYATVIVKDVSYVLENSDARVIIVEDSVQLAKALESMKEYPQLEKIIVIEASGCDLSNENVISFDELSAMGRDKHKKEPELFEQLADAVKPEDLLTLQYTSGSTGVPKGAMLTHGNIMSAIKSLISVNPPFSTETDNVVGFLPLSHVFERIPVHYYIMYQGVPKAYAGSMDTLLEDIKLKRPTIMFAVPRVHEKIYQKMTLSIKEKPKVVQNLFAWAQKVGNNISKYKEDKVTPPLSLKIQHKIAYALVFKKLQEALGGRLRWMCAAGGPISKEIVNFFNAAGIFVLEGYGLSEVCGGATLSNLNDFCPGSVGRPLPEFDIKIAEDGEILIKGGAVTPGYWKMEEKTKEAFDEDGHFKTGDIGQLDERGLLFITDRIKDIIITSGGKNIAPQKIESLFKNNPLFTQFMVIGDRRKFLSALMTLDIDIAANLAQENNIQYEKKEDLLGSPEFLAIVDKIVEETNSHLARVETIKKYVILNTEFSFDGGELTVSMKLKKNQVVKKYKKEIEALYID